MRRLPLRTVIDCVKYLQKEFIQNKIHEPTSSAEYIVAHAMGCKTLAFVRPSLDVSRSQLRYILSMMSKRKKHIPVQYILGQWDFRDLLLDMKPPVFIPRPETEELIDYIIDTEDEPRNIIDIGCGSGAISLALLREYPHSRCLALDQSKAACQLTLHNAVINSLAPRLSVVCGNVSDPCSLLPKLPLPFDLAVSNPPYIPDHHMRSLSREVRQEDPSALAGGADGADVIKDVIRLAAGVLRCDSSLWLEVDPSHPRIIDNFLEDNPQLGFEIRQILNDFNNRPRFLQLVYSVDAT